MKLIGNLLLVVCLITGCLSAATAYLTPAEAASAEGVVLSEPAGAEAPSDAEIAELRAAYEAGEITAETLVRQLEEPEPVVPAGAVLDEQALAEIRAENIEFVETKSFSITSWPYGWVFGLSAVGLLAGSLLVRFGAKREIAAEGIAPERDAQLPKADASPQQIVETIGDALETLHRELPNMSSDQERLKAIITRAGALQKDAIPRFIESRPKIVASVGLGRYAEIMDYFAAMERKINRAWSAAADGHLPESQASLDDAVEKVPAVREKLAGV
jgi:hypothetical protein